MLNVDSIEQFETHVPGVYAFRIKGEVSRDDLEAMASTMNDAFDQLDEVDMLVSLQSDGSAELGAGLSMEFVKSQFRSLSKVRNYCVVQPTDKMEGIIGVFDKILGVNARTFSSEHNAIEHLRAQEPAGQAGA